MINNEQQTNEPVSNENQPTIPPKEQTFLHELTAAEVQLVEMRRKQVKQTEEFQANLKQKATTPEELERVQYRRRLFKQLTTTFHDVSASDAKVRAAEMQAIISNTWIKYQTVVKVRDVVDEKRLDDTLQKFIVVEMADLTIAECSEMWDMFGRAIDYEMAKREKDVKVADLNIKHAE